MNKKQTVEVKIGNSSIVILKSDEEILKSPGISWYVPTSGFDVVGRSNDRLTYIRLRYLIAKKHKIKSKEDKYYLKDYSRNPVNLTPFNITGDPSYMIEHRKKQRSSYKNRNRLENIHSPVFKENKEMLDVKEIYDLLCDDCQSEIKNHIAKKYLNLG